MSRGARLITPSGEQIVMPGRWLQHSVFLTTALEFAEEGVSQTIPVPVEADALADIQAWCQFMETAMQPYRLYGEDDDAADAAADVAWKLFRSRHKLKSLTAVGQLVEAAAGQLTGKAAASSALKHEPAPVVVVATVAATDDGPTVDGLLRGGGPCCLAPIFRLICAADLLEVPSFLRVASTCMREYMQQLSSEQIRMRFGDEPDLPLHILEDFLRPLDVSTLRVAQQAGPFWRAQTQKLLPPPVPYHGTKAENSFLVRAGLIRVTR